jgi:hypothetical protein
MDCQEWRGDSSPQSVLERIDAIKRDHPPPSALPAEPQNMPYYRGPRLPKNVPDVVSAIATTLVPTITYHRLSTLDELAYLVWFLAFASP